MENENEKLFLEKIKSLRIRLAEAEETISAIRGGGVDAIVVSGLKGEQVFTLTGAERAYRILIETMNEGAASLNLEGMIIYCNQRLAEMLKTPLEKVIGAPMRQFIRASDLPVFDSLMEKGLQKSGKGEVAMINTDGAVLPVLLSVSELQKDNADICGITVTDLTAQKHIEDELRRHRDHLEELVKDRTSELETSNRLLLEEIAERNLAESDLRESEERFKKLFIEAPLGIAVIDSQTGQIYRANPMFAKITGKTIAELSQIDWMSITHPDDAQKDLDSMALFNAGKTDGFQMEKRYLHHNGAIVWVNMTIARLKSEVQENPRHLCMIEEISERKRGEMELIESKALVEAVVENVPLMIFLKDAEDLRFVVFNRAGEELLGFDRKDLLGKNDLDLFPPELAAHFMATDRKVLDGETGVLDIPEEPILTSKGGERLLHTRKVCIRGADGTTKYLLGISEDITEHRKLEAQLRQSQKMEAIGQLAGGVAHDFNNILSAIFGYSQLSLRKLQENDPVKEYVEQIMKASERAAVLTQSLLIFSRKQEVTLAVIDLSNVVKDFEIFLQRLIREDIDLKVSCNEEHLTVMADRGQIEQVIMNLVANGRDAMPNGGKLHIDTISVTLDQEFVATHGYGKAGVYAVISVSDSGNGMDKETQSHIFEPFYTTKEQGKGTGLGLSMAYGIIKKHDGFINIYSEPGTGTIFKIYLPQVSDVALADKTGPEVSIALRGGSETILLCEDDAILRKLAANVFSHFGYRVIEAIDGRDAIDKFVAHKESIDLVFIDAIMPKKNGKEASDEMKIVRPDIKTIFVSGYSQDIFAGDSPFDANTIFIHKPYSPNELLTKTRELLDKNSRDLKAEGFS